MKILALPRNSNPYQEFLYGEIRRAGHDVRYAGQVTPLHTLNLLLLPLEIAACRVAGWRVLHLHWVFAFQIPGSGRLPWLRKVARAWFALVLCVGRRLGMHVVWTAHNVLPHERVFDDDLAARRLLVRSSDLVFAHSAATFDAYAYGKGLSAYLTKYVLSRHRCLDMLRRLPHGLRQLCVLATRSGEAGACSGLDRRLMLAELYGLFMGPGVMFLHGANRIVATSPRLRHDHN